MSDALYVGDLEQGLDQVEVKHLHDAAKVAASWAVVPRPKTKSSFLLRAKEIRIRLQQLDEFLTSPPGIYSRRRCADERLPCCNARIAHEFPSTWGRGCRGTGQTSCG